MEKNKKTIVDSQWMNDETFIVRFKTQVGFEDGESILIKVIAEYNSKTKGWLVKEGKFTLDGVFIESVEMKSGYDSAEYKTLAEYELKKSFQVGDSWDNIIVKDDYEKYDALTEIICDYYAGFQGESIVEDVENIINSHFMELLRELDEKYK